MASDAVVDWNAILVQAVKDPEAGFAQVRVAAMLALSCQRDHA